MRAFAEETSRRKVEISAINRNKKYIFKLGLTRFKTSVKCAPSLAKQVSDTQQKYTILSNKYFKIIYELRLTVIKSSV